MKKVEVVLVDDIDGTATAQETVKFTYRGKTYEIDLSEANLAKFDKFMEQYTAKARSYGGSSRSKKEQASRDDIRSWAKEQGLKVGARGRIPASVLREYYKASA